MGKIPPQTSDLQISPAGVDGKSGLNIADKGQVAVFAVKIQPIANQKIVVAVQGAKICLILHGAAAFFIDGHGRCHLGGTIGAQGLAYFFHGKSGIQHIIYHQHLFALAVGQGIVPLELAGALRAGVTGDSDGLQLKLVGRWRSKSAAYQIPPLSRQSATTGSSLPKKASTC